MDTALKSTVWFGLVTNVEITGRRCVYYTAAQQELSGIYVVIAQTRGTDGRVTASISPFLWNLLQNTFITCVYTENIKIFGIWLETDQLCQEESLDGQKSTKRET